MGKYVDHAAELRNHPTVHYNCAQSVMVPFAEKMGMTHDQIFQLGAHLGAGMRHGSACGALSGALIVLGSLGYDEAQSKTLINDFMAAHSATDCHTLLLNSAERGEAKKPHCDGLVLEMAAAIEALIGA